MSRHPQQLIDAMLDGEIDAESLAALESWLAASPENPRIFARQSILHGHMRSLTASAPQAADSSRETRNAELPGSGVRDRSGFRVPGSALWFLAAALLIAACGVAVVGFVLSDRRSAIGDRQSNAPVASVIDITDGTLTIGDHVAGPGQDYAGEIVTLDSGAAEFMVASGTTISLHGESRLTIHDPMTVTLTRGSAAFDCPPSAKGYTVHLPCGARIVDLGTRFIVSVDTAGRTGLRVVEGRVELTDLLNGRAEFVTGQAGVVIDRRFFPVASAIDPSPIEVAVSEPMPAHTFAAASDDLLQTAAAAVEFAGPASARGAFPSQAIESLTDGPTVYRPGAVGTHESWSTHDGGAVTWRLDRSAAPFGYDIDRVDVLAAYSPARLGHVYAISVVTIDSDEFVPLVEVDHPDHARETRGGFERRATVKRADGDPLATGVTAIRFTFRDDNAFGANLGQSVFREIDVIGRPSEIHPATFNLSDEPADRREGSSDADVPLGRK